MILGGIAITIFPHGGSAVERGARFRKAGMLPAVQSLRRSPKMPPPCPPKALDCGGHRRSPATGPLRAHTLHSRKTSRQDLLAGGGCRLAPRQRVALSGGRHAPPGELWSPPQSRASGGLFGRSGWVGAPGTSLFGRVIGHFPEKTGGPDSRIAKVRFPATDSPPGAIPRP